MLHGIGHQSVRDSSFILPLSLSLLFVPFLHAKNEVLLLNFLDVNGLTKRFHLNGNTTVFHPQIKKLEAQLVS